MAKLAESGRIWPIWPPRGGLVLARGGPDPARGGPESGPGGSRIGSQKSGPSPRNLPEKFPEFGFPGRGSRNRPKSDYDRYPGLRSRTTEYNLSHPHRICANSGPPRESGPPPGGVRIPELGPPLARMVRNPGIWPIWPNLAESGQSGPESGQSGPESGQSGPESGQSGPGIWPIWPNLAKSGPGIWPKVANLAESGQIWPNPGNRPKVGKSGQNPGFSGIFPKYVSLNTPK